jgi:hypothetical protein
LLALCLGEAMNLRMWMLDIAREQSPTLGDLRRYLDVTQEAGFNAVGFYLEHRFAYPSTPWSHGKGCVTPDMILSLQNEYPDLQIIPFINLLGHFEGMIYTEYGKRFREEKFKGLQACPCVPEFVDLCNQLIDDTISIFKSEIIHIGGDETQQLGACPICKEKVADWESTPGTDGKAILYGEHFGPLASKVVEKGRRPAVWGDMFFEHPTALELIPSQTLVFDWQYFNSPLKTSRLFVDKGFEVVCCPAVHTYNATWCHLPQTEQNVRDHVAAAKRLNAAGVCVTTWECGLFGNYETLLPLIRGCGSILKGQSSQTEIQEESDMQLDCLTPTSPTSKNQPYANAPAPKAFLDAYGKESEAHEKWASLMGLELQKVGGSFAFTGTRSSLKVRLLLNANPFLCWLYHSEEFAGEVGDKALAIFNHAIAIAPNASMRGVAEFGKQAIEFVRYADQARQAYAQGLPGVAVSSLAPCRQIFENLEKVARATRLNTGGSLADIERCRVAKEHVERVMLRIKEYGDGSLGYLPAFEIITHPKFMPHDQANWWLINRWANE